VTVVPAFGIADCDVGREYPVHQGDLYFRATTLAGRRERGTTGA
jgi:hypothetical protein